MLKVHRAFAGERGDLLRLIKGYEGKSRSDKRRDGRLDSARLRDVQPQNEMGGGSIAPAKNLNINANAKTRRTGILPDALNRLNDIEAEHSAAAP